MGGPLSPDEPHLQNKKFLYFNVPAYIRPQAIFQIEIVLQERIDILMLDLRQLWVVCYIPFLWSFWIIA